MKLEKKIFLIDLTSSYEGGGKVIFNFFSNQILCSENDNAEFIILTREAAGFPKMPENVKEIIVTDFGVLGLATFRAWAAIKFIIEARKTGSQFCYVKWGTPNLIMMFCKAICFQHNILPFMSFDVQKKMGVLNILQFAIMRLLLKINIYSGDIKVVVASQFFRSKLENRYQSQRDLIYLLRTPALEASHYFNQLDFNSRKRTKALSSGKLRICSISAYSPYKMLSHLCQGLRLLSHQGIPFDFMNYGAIRSKSLFLDLCSEFGSGRKEFGSTFTFFDDRLSSKQVLQELLDSDLAVFCSGAETNSLVLKSIFSLNLPVVVIGGDYLLEGGRVPLSHVSSFEPRLICSALLKAVSKLENTNERKVVIDNQDEIGYLEGLKEILEI